MIKKYINSILTKIYYNIPFAIAIFIILYLVPFDSYFMNLVTFISEHLDIDIFKKNIKFFTISIHKIIVIIISIILNDIFKFGLSKIKKKKIIKPNPSWRYSLTMENFNLKIHRNISKLNYEEWLKQKQEVDYSKKKLKENKDKNIVHDLRSNYINSLYKLNKIEERCNKDLQKLNSK